MTKPEPALMDLLVAVSQTAEELAADIHRLGNVLSVDFEKAAFDPHIEALILLPKTLAGECYAPLMNARERLLGFADPIIISEDEADSHEELWADGPIDQRFKTLDNLVGKALVEYHKHYQGEEAIPKEPETLPPPANPAALDDTVTALDAASHKVDEVEDAARPHLDAGKDPAADNFFRTLTGGKVSYLIAISELRQRVKFKHLLEAAKRKVGEFANNLDISIRNLKPMAKDLERIIQNPVTSLYKLAEAASGKFKALTRDWRKPARPATVPPVDPQVQKAAEKEATRLLEQNQTVPDDIAENVREIKLSSSSFSKPFLLINLKWLQSLDLGNTEESDISVLENLTALQALSLWNTNVSNISVLENLTALQSLNLTETNVSDISVLENLASLQWLSLGRTNVSDISVLENLTALKTLYLRDTKVSDISGLAKLTALHSLDLQDTRVRDWRPVAHVKEVEGRPDDWDKPG